MLKKMLLLIAFIMLSGCAGGVFHDVGPSGDFTESSLHIVDIESPHTTLYAGDRVEFTQEGGESHFIELRWFGIQTSCSRLAPNGVPIAKRGKFICDGVAVATYTFSPPGADGSSYLVLYWLPEGIAS